MSHQSKRVQRLWPVMVLVLTLAAVPAAAGSVWFKATVGSSGMAMDDINDATYKFYDTPINGYNFPDLDSGFNLSFHLGNDISESMAFGMSWEIQHGHVSGTDVNVTADMKLDADFFMGHLYWTPVRGEKFNLGAAGGMGFVAADGIVKISEGNVNFGQNEASGSDLVFELMGVAEYALSDSKGLQLTAGWRLAEISKVKYAGATVVKEDGENLSLDYTGYTLKLGMIWRFSGGAAEDIQ